MAEDALHLPALESPIRRDGGERGAIPRLAPGGYGDRTAPPREEVPPPWWRGGGVSFALHGLIAALVLYAVSVRTPPEPAATPAPVAMVFSPSTSPSPKLPEAVPTEATPAPTALLTASPAEPLPPAPPAAASVPPARQDLPIPLKAPAPLTPAAPEERVSAHPPAPSPPQPRPAPPRPAAAPKRLATAAPLPPTPLPAPESKAGPVPPQPFPAPSGGAAPGPAHPPNSPPEPLSAVLDPAPDYPQLALRRREQGNVILRVVVAPDGLPRTVSVEQSSGHPLLDHAAVEAVQHWRFRPATEGGMPVVGTARVPIRFVISN